jgi:hypothetical protein
MFMALMAALFLVFTGCVSDKTRPVEPGDTLDSAVPGDTSDTGSGSSDTGDPPPPEPVAVTVESEPVVCDQPQLREELGPMRLIGPGGDWAHQNGLANLWSLYGGQGLAVSDFDGDGWFDIFLPNADGDQLYMGRVGSEWTDESDARLPSEDDVGVGATAVDFDGDGDVDIFVAVLLAPNRLLINDGSGHFESASAPWLEGQTRLSSGSAWSDIDSDGDLDAFVANYGNWSESWLESVPMAPADPSMDALWINDGSGGFDNGDDRFVGFNPIDAFTFMGGFWDVDQDGDGDLLTVNDYRFEYDWAQPVRLLINDGGIFVDPPESVGLNLETEGMGLGVGDLNGDGLIDFAVSAAATHLMLSDGEGGYFESAAARGITSSIQQQVGWGAELADLDNDGRLDLSVAYGLLPPDEVTMGPMPEIILGDRLNMNWVEQPDALYVQDLSGNFTDVAEAWGLDHTGISRGFVLADLNRDGFLDRVSRDMWGPAQMSLSRCDDSAWLSIHLKQSGANPFAIGAEVTASVGEQRWTRWVQAGSTNLSSGGPTEVHIGLGTIAQVDRLEVRWPDGAYSVLEDVQTRAKIRLERTP